MYRHLCVLLLALSTAVSATLSAREHRPAHTPDSDTPELESVAEHSHDKKTPRLTVGGYGEAVMARNFFSDNYLRYSQADKYKDGKGHGRFDIPHAVIYIGYDFGRGWSMATEIEFEHGGIEAAIEIEQEEAGEYETEVERGGEVALEQFWIQKSWSPALNLRMGHIIVPVGATNSHHMPTEFFGVYRPEGENTIMPCTWHQTGISLWGSIAKWRYEIMLLPGMDSDRFNSQNWIGGSAGSPYEFKIANAYAGAFRVDNRSVKGLRLSLSGYAGNSFSNTLSPTKNDQLQSVRGTILLGAFDLAYDDHNTVIRANFDYGHLSDSGAITAYNKGLSKNSPSPKQPVASDAIAAGIEFGYDFFSLNGKLHSMGQRFYLFTRYDYYDSMFGTDSNVGRLGWCGRQRIAVGINYYPIKNIAIKAEYAVGVMKSAYNNEPSLLLGIAYSGIFRR